MPGQQHRLPPSQTMACMGVVVFKGWHMAATQVALIRQNVACVSTSAARNGVQPTATRNCIQRTAACQSPTRSV
jgi:hypothetical protein